jgi:hypothetical protein
MALKVRLMGPKGGSRLRRGLRAAFRGSIVAFDVPGLQLAFWTLGGCSFTGAFFGPCLSAGNDRFRTGTNMRNPTV